jgi:hypothetical protein
VSTIRSLAPVGVAASLVWILGIAVDRALTTGAWLAVVRDTTALVALTVLLAVVAAVVDDWVEEQLRGSGGIR